MGMVQAGDYSRFIQVSPDVFRPGYPLSSGNLDRNGSIKLAIIAQQDLAEPSLSQDLQNAVHARYSWYREMNMRPRTPSSEGWS